MDVIKKQYKIKVIKVDSPLFFPRIHGSESPIHKKNKEEAEDYSPD